MYVKLDPEEFKNLMIFGSVFVKDSEGRVLRVIIDQPLGIVQSVLDVYLLVCQAAANVKLADESG